MITFLIFFSKTFTEENAPEIRKCYKEYLKLSASNEISLDFEAVKEVIGSKDFLCLYKELINRNAPPDPVESWKIYQEVFIRLRSLPDIWVWDILHEFSYNYQNFSSLPAQHNWKKETVFKIFEPFYSDLSKFGYFAYIGLLKMLIFEEDHQEISRVLTEGFQRFQIKELDPEVFIKSTYELGFAYLVAGKCTEASNCFLDVLSCLKQFSKEDIEDEKILATYTQHCQKCLSFCLVNNSKLKKTFPKTTVSSIESDHLTVMDEWKDGKIEAFWSFFSECSPYSTTRSSTNLIEPNCKAHNLKCVKFCLQRVTIWKPLRNLKGLLKVCEVLELGEVPKSILPVPTESDIKFFCDNNNGLLRLVNSKSSGIEKVLQEFKNIHQKETLTLLIMQYHKILRKQRHEERILAFGRKFVNVLKVIGYSGRINVEDAMSYIREVSKISMEAANKLVEDQ
ncbi:hypothetical protein GCK72_008131 [Caenorhabditis remanei]|uniref:Uncharacterized protein n=1 Tax=Caenorhabditis remanei TaxID=31234 RepID=A0A6A5HKX4_CAERE|nr:hypothetical protein GCK72_008131 [Caenorhabditis remanei]KAF1768169.1 hypothetical protein GCK72_008131 [Caenorhabditis remanei]